MKIAIPALICVALITASCENEVKFRGGGPAAKIIVNSIASTGGGEFFLKTSESVFIFGDKKPEPLVDAALRLSLNGTDVPLEYGYANVSTLFYKFRADLSAGNRLEVFGEAPGYEKIHGSDVVPGKAEIKDVKTEWFTAGEPKQSFLRTLITVKDKPGEKNYYRIVVRNRTVWEGDDPIFGGYDPERVPWKQKDVLVDQEPLFGNTGFFLDEDSHPYRIFSDDLFEGGEYTLNVYFPLVLDKGYSWTDEDGITHSTNPRHFVKAEIHTLSENLYKYLYSLELANSQDDFSEPVKIHSNIRGGYGILGTYNVAEKELEVK